MKKEMLILLRDQELALNLWSELLLTACHWEAESGGDYRQDVGKTPCFDQPAKLYEPQRCEGNDERGRASDPIVGWGEL